MTSACISGLASGSSPSAPSWSTAASAKSSRPALAAPQGQRRSGGPDRASDSGKNAAFGYQHFPYIGVSRLPMALTTAHWHAGVAHRESRVYARPTAPRRVVRLGPESGL